MQDLREHQQEQEAGVEGAVEQLFDAIEKKDLTRVKQIVKENPKLDLNCLDKNELTPLQHACHNGDSKLAQFILDNGGLVDFSKRKDRYTPLMFAAISSKIELVRLLLKRGADVSIENCVNRTAAQMAAFVGQSKAVAIINNWIDYKSTIEPYTRCRELESEPRIPTPQLGELLHQYVTYPSLHPVKILFFIRDNQDLVTHSDKFIYVLENLLSKTLKKSSCDECLAVKFHYLSYILDSCAKCFQAKKDSVSFPKCVDSIVRRLIKKDGVEAYKGTTKQLDQYVTGCIIKFPYPQYSIFRTLTCSLQSEQNSGYEALSRTLNSPHRMIFQPPEACNVCGEVEVKNRKCGKCNSVYYCSPDCQLADWFQHKKVCKESTIESTAGLSDEAKEED